MTESSKLRLRRVWFQAHRWIGLLLFLLLIPLGLSGSLLVWDKAADRLVNPQRYLSKPSVAALPPDRYVAAAATVLRGEERIASLALPGSAGEPVLVTASFPPPGGAGRPGRHLVWIDPATGRLLDHADGNAGVLRFLHRFHGSLLVPGVGRAIVGWLGWAMLASALTGIWLWWPVTGSVRRGFRWKRGARTSANLHHRIGIWLAIPLALLSFTGAVISFPGLFGSAPNAVRSSALLDARPDPRLARPLAAPRLAPSTVMMLAGAPGAVTQLRWPTNQDPVWTVSAGKIARRIDDASGRLLASTPDRTAPGSGFGRLMRGLHDGHDYNPVWQIVIVLAGLAPALLGITGVMMWLRAGRLRRDKTLSAISY